MNIETEILRILSEAGSKGMSVQKLSLHVFNAQNTLFDDIAFDDIHDAVAQYLQRNSKRKNGYIEKMPDRGVYRLNLESGETQQLMLQFRDEEEPDTTTADTTDNSLSLFDWTDEESIG